MSFGPMEIAIIAIVIFALFGYKKLPDATRAIGRSLRIFKGEMKGMKDESVETKAEAQTVRGELGTPTTTAAAQDATPPATPTVTTPELGTLPVQPVAQPVAQPATQPVAPAATPAEAAQPAQPRSGQTPAT